MITDLTEIFINMNDENYDADTTLDIVKKAIDRDDVDGVMLAFTQGVSVFIEEITNPELDLAQYEEFVVSNLEKVLGDKMGEIEFIF
ncbi:hypothetical protein VPHK567_0132 [Vibrio phage K567]|nr:hypothetical protein MYOV011v1_p0076 [Vibrio phage 6E35.1a]